MNYNVRETIADPAGNKVSVLAGFGSGRIGSILRGIYAKVNELFPKLG
jgi:hypothetical protein